MVLPDKSIRTQKELIICMKKYTFIAFVQFFALNCLLFFVPVTAVHGQTASLMDEALSAGALSYAQAAYFVLTAADINYNAAGAGYTDNGYSSEKAAITAAFSYAASQGWLPKKVSPTVEGSGDKVIKLSELSFLMIKSFKLKGNILYRIFPGPHYAYKEMVYRGYITGTTDPSLPLNGEKFFEILGNLLSEVPEIERQTTELAADERAAAERQAAERADAEQQAAELAAAERQATAERLAAERADAERQAVERAAAELAAAERQAAAERLATERAEAERQAVERAAAELAAAERQAATERLAAERQAEAEHLAAEGAEAERQAVERAAAERLAAERADAERQAAERTAAELAAVERQAEAERLSAERADAERQAAERAAAELAAVERQAATERLAAERADAERQAAERAAVERQAAAERLAVERQAAAERQAADESQVTLTETITTISRVHIQFTADALILSETQKIKLQEVAQILSRYPDWPIQIAGHTAQAGSISGQQMISRDRAQIVADYLESLGCRRADEMTVIGYGATQPLADNSTAAGMALNRRVEITFAGQDAVQAAKTEAITTISRIRIQFTADASVLGNAEKTKLQEAAQILSRYPGRSIRLEGHTAMAGGEEGRQQISQDRAQAVADYLESLGCRRSDEMTVIGYGASQPLADNSTAAGMALNRRVEITILD
jgi:outer membrane protein OmpA-like peptidoglycan-associated protein